MLQSSVQFLILKCLTCADSTNAWECPHLKFDKKELTENALIDHPLFIEIFDFIFAFRYWIWLHFAISKYPLLMSRFGLFTEVFLFQV